MPEFLHFTKMSLAENRAITFPYYFKRVDTFYDVVLKGTHHNNIVDIFCLDSTELHKAQQKLSATNNKLAMALDVANIVPLNGICEAKPYFATSIDLLSLAQTIKT